MSFEEVSGLQGVADYFASRKNMSRRWRTNLILGVLVILLGFFYSLLLSPLNLILIIIGLLLVIVAIRSRVVLRLNSLLLSGIALSIVAIWNFVVSITNLALAFSNYEVYGANASFSGFGFIWGGLFLAWGVDAIIRYRRYSAVSSVKPSEEMLQRVEYVIKPILNADVGRERDIIEFKTAGTWSTNSWKAKLGETYATLVSKGACDISFVRPEELEITEQGRAGVTQFRKASIRIKGSKSRGSISPLSLQRYGLWRDTLLRTQQSKTQVG